MVLTHSAKSSHRTGLWPSERRNLGSRPAEAVTKRRRAGRFRSRRRVCRCSHVGSTDGAVGRGLLAKLRQVPPAVAGGVNQLASMSRPYARPSRLRVIELRVRLATRLRSFSSQAQASNVQDNAVGGKRCRAQRARPRCTTRVHPLDTRGWSSPFAFRWNGHWQALAGYYRGQPNSPQAILSANCSRLSTGIASSRHLRQLVVLTHSAKSRNRPGLWPSERRNPGSRSPEAVTKRRHAGRFRSRRRVCLSLACWLDRRSRRSRAVSKLRQVPPAVAGGVNQLASSSRPYARPSRLRVIELRVRRE